MKDLNDHERMCEEAFGLISGYMIYSLHALSTANGSEWDINDPSTMDIIVTKGTADEVYGICKEVASGYVVGLSRAERAKIKQARLEAHLFLMEEANDPKTTIKRKIELVKLTGKGKM